jgi:hypothetical protein
MTTSSFIVSTGKVLHVPYLPEYYLKNLGIFPRIGVYEGGLCYIPVNSIFKLCGRIEFM